MTNKQDSEKREQGYAGSNIGWPVNPQTRKKKPKP